MNAMPDGKSVENLVAWCESELTALRKLRDWMEADEFSARRRARADDAWVDITPVRLEATKRKITELEQLLMAIPPSDQPIAGQMPETLIFNSAY